MKVISSRCASPYVYPSRPRFECFVMPWGLWYYHIRLYLHISRAVNISFMSLRVLLNQVSYAFHGTVRINRVRLSTYTQALTLGDDVANLETAHTRQGHLDFDILLSAKDTNQDLAYVALTGCEEDPYRPRPRPVSPSVPSQPSTHTPPCILAFGIDPPSRILCPLRYDPRNRTSQILPPVHLPC